MTVQEIGRDLADRNGFVGVTIRRVMNPDLQAPLDDTAVVGGLIHRASTRIGSAMISHIGI